MDKQAIISKIIDSLSQIGIFPQTNTTADVIVDCEFLDAKWSTGKKKIEYHSSAYFDEVDKVLYYWESTKEVSSGFSFGSKSESSFQSGMTLFRKVKSVGFGPDGKAFEYSIDLGAITKTFKEAAKDNGYKFKVVLKKDKASYPSR